MSMLPLTETKSAVRFGSNSANIVRLGNRSGRHAKDRSVIFKVEGCSTKAVIPKLATAGEGSGAPEPACVIVNFAPDRHGGYAVQDHKKLSNENETTLTLTDCIVITYVVASVAFYPALVWLLL